MKSDTHDFPLISRCVICGSPIFEYLNRHPLYCDGMTGADCMTMVRLTQRKMAKRRIRIKQYGYAMTTMWKDDW